MRREPLKYIFVTLIVAAGIFEVSLLLSGRRALIDEEYFPEHPGIIGSAIYAEEAKFQCTYFTGRKLVQEELSAQQYDECPFIWNEG